MSKDKTKTRRFLKLPLGKRADHKKRYEERMSSSGKGCEPERDLGRYWKLEALEDCFCFSIQGDPSKDIYVEFSELLATGEAYQERQPQSAFNLLERLERSWPGFEGIYLDYGLIFLERKRIDGGKGLLQTVESGLRKVRFWSDPTLKTINFYDLYFDYLQIIREENADNALRLSKQSDEDSYEPNIG